MADDYWSSTTLATSSTNAWRVHMYDGSVFALNKVNAFYVWPVRGGP
jgi:hypothetical protein